MTKRSHILAAVVLLLAVTGSRLAAAAPSQADILAPLDRFITAFNRWDLDFPQATFTDDCVVMDIFPPFLWQGFQAPRRWWSVLSGPDAASHLRKAALHEHLERGALEAMSVTGDDVQFVAPATLTYEREGRRRQVHGRWIITEHRSSDGWRISAHAWATVNED